MTAFPRWLELELAVEGDLPPPTTDAVQTSGSAPAAPEVSMADEKRCSKCGKKLRSDNSKGMCSQAGPCAKRAAAAGNADDDRVLDALKRFRVVAEAMGHDPDQLLATYCEGWLAAVKQAVDKLEAPADE